MSPVAFKRSLSHAVPPRALAPELQALWWAGKGDWDKAHSIVMAEPRRWLPGCTPTCIASKATTAMRATGTGRRSGKRWPARIARRRRA